MEPPHEEDRTSADFASGYGEGIYRDRSHQHASIAYGARGGERSDREGRQVIRENLRLRCSGSDA